jgi:hypothetical protein
MNKKNHKLTGKPYEQLVFKIYKELEPYADIRFDDKIMGVESGTYRQIDISIRYKVAGGHSILIIIQAKDHKKSADIKVLGEFSSVIRDVRASKGILICSSGFTKTAKEYAKNQAIEICSAYDASVQDWISKIKIPVIKRKSIIKAKMKFILPPFGGISGSKMNIEFVPSGGVDKREIFEVLASKIAEGELLIKEGDYEYILGHKLELTARLHGVIQHRVSIDNVQINYNIEHRYYYKYFTPEEYRGIENILTKEVTTSYIKLRKESELFSIIEDGSWKYMKDSHELGIANNCVFIEHIFLPNGILGITHNFFKAFWVDDEKLVSIIEL